MTFDRPSNYIPRIVDDQITRYLDVFGAIEITGTKWCGKTWAALTHGQSVSYVDDNVALAKADPSMMLMGDKPHVIDEWQLAPSIWDKVRHEVDRTRNTRGAFILTGSSTPAAADDLPTHSGAGRIGRIRMHPMTLQESGDSTGQVSIAELFNGNFEPCRVPVDTIGLVNVACRGGWPEAVNLSVADAQLVAREYISIAMSQGIPRIGLDPDTARRTVQSIVRNLGQSTTYKTIIGDMFGAEENPQTVMNEDKVRTYLTGLRSMFLLEEIPGWAPPARAKKRFMTKPKRYLADPSLAVAMLGMSPDALIGDWQTFGLVFENMAIRDLMVYTRALELLDDIPVRYYRDDSGLEADAIIQLADGRWAAFEIKTSEDKVDEGLDNLRTLEKKLTSNPKAQVKPPSFMAVITGNSEYARQVDERLYVIPIRALGK